MVFVTGDTHGRFARLRQFGKETPYITKDDVLIVCGDFGIWHDDEFERAQLDSVNRQPFTTVFVDGNHSNFDRLYSDEFPTVDFHGAKAHQIRDSIFHIKRGEVMELEGKKFFCFGGAKSHDIQDGIIDRADYESEGEYEEEILYKTITGQLFRINHESWWKEEMPSYEEYDNGARNLSKHNWKVDYVVTHCLPTNAQAELSAGLYKSDKLTDYFQMLIDVEDHILQFKEWMCGHYHDNVSLPGGFTVRYESINRIL